MKKRFSVIIILVSISILIFGFNIGKPQHVSFANSPKRITNKNLYVIVTNNAKQNYKSLIDDFKLCNVKIITEKDLPKIREIKPGTCFLTLGDKNSLIQVLKNRNINFCIKDVPGTNHNRNFEKNILNERNCKSKLIFEPESNEYIVLYGVKILNNRLTDQLEWYSNRDNLRLNDTIINWINEDASKYPMQVLNPLFSKASTSGSGDWVFKGARSNYTERYPYGNVYYSISFYKMQQNTNDPNDYWAIAYTNYSTIPGWEAYHSGYQTNFAWIYNKPLSSNESLFDWSPTSTVGNTSYTVTIGNSPQPSLSWQYSMPDITVYDHSNPIPPNTHAYWSVDYSNARDKAPCKSTFVNRPGSEFTVPKNYCFSVEVDFDGGFSYSHWYGWDRYAYPCSAYGNYVVCP